jgi:undecaprenyl-diphosphatase
MALWLDTVCHGFDYAVLSAIHAFALAAGDVMTFFMRAITMLADHGYGMIALGLILFAFKRTRKLGLAALFGIAVGALITNVTLKPLVFRARPYTHEEYRVMWEQVLALTESERSFPSGHTTSAMAAMMGIFLAAKHKKRFWPVLIFPVLMGFTRLYFVVHYPTDVLGGLIAGAAGALGGFLLVYLLYRFLEKHKENKACAFYFNFDPIVTGVRWILSKCQSKPVATTSAVEKDDTPTE